MAFKGYAQAYLLLARTERKGNAISRAGRGWGGKYIHTHPPTHTHICYFCKIKITGENDEFTQLQISPCDECISKF